jgi:hypothetical protein
MIDWMSPSDDILEAKRVGYHEAMAECEEKIAELKEQVAAAHSENDRFRSLFANLSEWSSTFGKALCPPRADTYGEGVHDCKEQVSNMLSELGGRPDNSDRVRRTWREMCARGLRQSARSEADLDDAAAVLAAADGEVR